MPTLLGQNEQSFLAFSKQVYTVINFPFLEERMRLRYYISHYRGMPFQSSHWDNLNNITECVFLAIIGKISTQSSQRHQLIFSPAQLKRREASIKLFFLFLTENICCRYSSEAPRRGTSNKYPQHMFSVRNKKKYPSFWVEKSVLTWDKVPQCHWFFFPVISKNIGDKQTAESL